MTYKILKWKIVKDCNGHENTCVKLRGYNEWLRPKAEVLVFRNDEMFILFTKKGYRLPGGNQEIGENIFDTVQRECNEELELS